MADWFSSATGASGPTNDPWAHIDFLGSSAPRTPALASSPIPGMAPFTVLPGSNSPNVNSGGLSGQTVAQFAPLVLSLLGGNNNQQTKAIGNTDQLATLGKNLTASGQASSATGMAALAPVLKYLTAVAGGDPSALFAATMPERVRVLDQYDTARKTLASTTPRGGGQAGAVGAMGAREASDLFTLTSSARTQGISDLTQLGTTLTSQGSQEQQVGQSDLNAAIQQQQQQADHQTQQDIQLAEGLASVVAMALI